MRGAQGFLHPPTRFLGIPGCWMGYGSVLRGRRQRAGDCSPEEVQRRGVCPCGVWGSKTAGATGVWAQRWLVGGWGSEPGVKTRVEDLCLQREHMDPPHFPTSPPLGTQCQAGHRSLSTGTKKAWMSLRNCKKATNVGSECLLM